MQIRPFIEMRVGQINLPLRVPISPLLVDAPVTTLSVNTAAGVSTLTVANTTGFSANYALLIGEPGNENSEIVTLSSVGDIVTLTLSGATSFPHSASTNVYLLRFNQIELSHAATVSGSKTVLTTLDITAGVTTDYNDLASSSGYYFARFKWTHDSSFSPYSDDVPYEGYTIRSARQIIDSALNEINKQESQTLTDEFAFQQLDNCQTEVIQDLKRWSFMQLFDQTIGHVTTGSWKVALPDDIGNDATNKSVYQLRVGANQRMIWVDKEKFDEFLVGVAYTTLAADANINDTTLTLTDSSTFNSTASQSEGSGSVTIGANTYAYSANDTSTGVLTLEDAITADTVATAGADVFQGATQGLPNYWTTYGGYIYYWPITSQSYNGFQLLMDYYTKQLKITSDSDIVVLPDPTVAIYYLCWKFLKKLSNGEETPESTAYMNQYQSRKLVMKNKEVMNRTFKFRPRIQNFAVQTAFNESTPRWIRDANFPNTGF